MKLVKYRGRRLKCNEEKRYVKHTDILRYIAKGGVIQVTCSQTKLDITNEVLRKCLELKRNIKDEEIYRLLRK